MAHGVDVKTLKLNIKVKFKKNVKTFKNATNILKTVCKRRIEDVNNYVHSPRTL